VLTNAHGLAEFDNLRITLGLTFARKQVDLVPVNDHTWLVKFGPVDLGLWDETRKYPSLIRPRRRRGPGRKVSAMSPV